MPPLIALIRHPPVLVTPGICYGATDVPLATQDFTALATPLVGLGLRTIWSSPLQRCLIPARCLAERLHLALVVDADLRELNFGRWEGCEWSGIPIPALDAWAADPMIFAPPDGEQGRNLIERVRRVAGRLRNETTATVILSHGGPLMLLKQLLVGLPLDLLGKPPPLGSVTILRDSFRSRRRRRGIFRVTTEGSPPRCPHGRQASGQHSDACYVEKTRQADLSDF